jgi:hypothetical protein
VFGDHVVEWRRGVLLPEVAEDATDTDGEVVARRVSVTTFADRGVDVVSVGRAELCWRLAAREGDEELGGANMSVLRRLVVDLRLENCRDGPGAGEFGRAAFCWASNMRAALAVLKDLRLRWPSGVRQSAKNLWPF